MKTTVKFLKALPVVAVLALGACGGDGGMILIRRAALGRLLIVLRPIKLLILRSQLYQPTLQAQAEVLLGR